MGPVIAILSIIYLVGVVATLGYLHLSKSEFAESVEGTKLAAVLLYLGWPLFLSGLVVGALSCLGTSGFFRGWNSVADLLVDEEEDG